MSIINKENKSVFTKLTVSNLYHTKSSLIEIVVNNNDVDLANMLYNSGYSFKIPNNNSNNPLTDSIELGHKEIFNFLLDKGLYLNYTNSNYTGLPIVKSANIDDIYFFKKLFSNENINIILNKEKNLNILHYACVHHLYKIIEFILNTGFPPIGFDNHTLEEILAIDDNQSNEYLKLKELIKTSIRKFKIDSIV